MKTALALIASTGLFALYLKLLAKIRYQQRKNHVKRCAVCQRRYRLEAVFCTQDASLLQFLPQKMQEVGLNPQLVARLPELQKMCHASDGE